MDNQYWLSIPYFVVMDEVDGEKERGKQEKQSLSEKETESRGGKEMMINRTMRVEPKRLKMNLLIKQ